MPVDRVVDNFSRRGTVSSDLHNNGIKMGQGRVYPASDVRKRTSVIFMKGRAHVGTLWTSGRRSLQAPSPSARLPGRLTSLLGRGPLLFSCAGVVPDGAPRSRPVSDCSVESPDTATPYLMIVGRSHVDLAPTKSSLTRAFIAECWTDV